MSDAHKFDFRGWLVPRVLLPMLVTRLIALG